MSVAEMREWVLRAFAFFAGASIGSFANVVIARLPKGESIVRPGSRCPHCKTPIRFYDNVPVVSWLVLRARCRACKAPISARYPVVELLLGLLALACVHRWGAPQAAGFFIFTALLVILSYIDLDTWLLPLLGNPNRVFRPPCRVDARATRAPNRGWRPGARRPRAPC